MTQEIVAPRKHSNIYNIFILVLTILSLIIMVGVLLPLTRAETELLAFYDDFICVIFLVDFILNLLGSHRKADYFIREGGWMDLLGSIPAFGIFRLAVLLRLFRLNRMAQIMRVLRGENKKVFVRDVVENRGRYALFITVCLAITVLMVASVLVLQFESKSPEANITTGGDAIWWGFVTITTVGYGDHYPVTPLGRVTAVFVMLAGVGIIGSLASILSRLLVPSPKEVADRTEATRESEPAPMPTALEQDLAQVKAELAVIRQLLEQKNTG